MAPKPRETTLSWALAAILATSGVMLAGGAAVAYAGHLLLTRPAGRLPTFMPGYIPRATMYHAPRYGHDLIDGGISIAVLGALCGFAVLILTISGGRRSPERLAWRRFGAQARSVGLTESGRRIFEIAGVRTTFSRRGHGWRPRVVCPTCGRERTSYSTVLASRKDLDRIRERVGWECRQCEREARSRLVGGDAR